MIISLISFTLTLRSWKNKFIINMPYSSVVTNPIRGNTPVTYKLCLVVYTETMLVFPTSITNNMNASYLRGRIDTSPAITRLTVPSGFLLINYHLHQYRLPPFHRYYQGARTSDFFTESSPIIDAIRESFHQSHYQEHHNIDALRLLNIILNASVRSIIDPFPSPRGCSN